ncbi:MAG: hypothetical protein J6K48_13620 [Lachnospiraceae bacterium]|nr:hypothetical protein [Lachnospiraceae bacterium]
MKKKLIAIMLGGLMMGMTACGNSSQEAVETMSETVETEATEEAVAEETEEITEETEEADTAASEEEVLDEVTEENTEEDTEVEEADFTLDEAYEKLIQYLNARPVILDQYYNMEDMNAFYCAAEWSWGYSNMDYTNIVTKDGFQGKSDDEETVVLNVSAACEFYYNFVNNDGESMSTVDYINNHTYDEIVNKYFKAVENGTYDGNTYLSDVIMADAIYLAKFMEENKDSISSDDLITEAPFSKDEVSGVKVAYELPIRVGENEAKLSVLFDKDGNMLNIVGESEEYEDSLHVADFDLQ